MPLIRFLKKSNNFELKRYKPIDKGFKIRNNYKRNEETDQSISIFDYKIKSD